MKINFQKILRRKNFFLLNFSQFFDQSRKKKVYKIITTDVFDDFNQDRDSTSSGRKMMSVNRINFWL